MQQDSVTPAKQCAFHGTQKRRRRQIRVDVGNNNTVQKINWEKLAKILVAENRNLSNLLNKHMTKRTTPIRKYECKHCGERLLSLQPYMEHMCQHEKEFDLEQSYSEEHNITCEHCYQVGQCPVGNIATLPTSHQRTIQVYHGALV